MKSIISEDGLQLNILDERFYLSPTNEDTYYPSVTTVLDTYPKGYGFTNWLKQVGYNADTIVQKAAETGTNVHNAIENINNGAKVRWFTEEGKELYTLEEWQMILKYKDFLEVFKPKIIHAEQQIVSDNLKRGGTIDLICEIDGEKWLIDFKSSNAVYQSYYLQIAAYKEMYEEKTGEKIDRWGILWLKSKTRGQDKKGKKIQGKGWQIKESKRTYEEDIEALNACRLLWDMENPNYKPKNIVYPTEIQYK